MLTVGSEIWEAYNTDFSINLKVVKVGRQNAAYRRKNNVSPNNVLKSGLDRFIMVMGIRNEFCFSILRNKAKGYNGLL